MKQGLLRKLPRIDDLMAEPSVAALANEHERELVLKCARGVVDAMRSEIHAAGDNEVAALDLSIEAAARRTVEAVGVRFAPSLRRVINATGIILHTGLGRAVMPESAAAAVADAVSGYCNLDIDLETGQRGSRQTHLENLLCELTGAEAALVVNNNAAATMLVLNTLASGEEVIISRGQLVEIGGSFRMPDVMASSGAIMREIGTTNKTHLEDYEKAVTEHTAAILHVHTSNYRIVGFSEEPCIAELAELAREHHLPIIDDLGSGALVDLSQYGLEPEPMVRDSIAAGVDAACFSGDKLIGGPQCGIIVGKKRALDAMKKNPLARAVRIGKMEIAALEATLRLFLEPSRLNERHPTYRMLSLKLSELDRRAKAMARKLSRVDAEVSVVDGSSQVGSGSVPAQMMPSRLLEVRPRSMSVDALAKRLRHHDPPIFARIHQEAVLFDFRTILPGEEDAVVRALRDYLSPALS